MRSQTLLIQARALNQLVAVVPAQLGGTWGLQQLVGQVLAPCKRALAPVLPAAGKDAAHVQAESTLLLLNLTRKVAAAVAKAYLVYGYLNLL